MNPLFTLFFSLSSAAGGAYLGESIALAVAVSWTVCALLSETVSRRLGAHVVNVLRMVLSLLFIGALLWVCTGSPLPPRADATTWGWLLASGLVGYVFGDYCLFKPEFGLSNSPFSFDDFNIKRGFLGQETICRHCCHEICGKSSDAPVARVFNLNDVLQFVVYRLDQRPFPQYNFIA